MIATITLNPSLDEHITVHGLVIEEANRWAKLHRYAGGKGIDVSRAIHEMGGVTVAYGFIGGDNGRDVEILLDEEGVLYSFTPIRRETRTNFIITDTQTYEQLRIDGPGPRISKIELERFLRKLRQVRPGPDMLTCGGSVSPGVHENIYYDIIMEGKEFGLRTILDSAGRWLESGIKARPFLIKPNKHEAGELLGREIVTEDDCIKAGLELVDTGIEIVVISSGKDGLIACTQNTIIRAVPPKVRVRSKVGAGDCTVAGLAMKLAYGGSLLDACRLAAAMGTASVLTRGTELCHRDDVERLLPKVRVWEIPVKDRVAGLRAAD